jgi:hypothetical protein
MRRQKSSLLSGSSTVFSVGMKFANRFIGEHACKPPTGGIAELRHLLFRPLGNLYIQPEINRSIFYLFGAECRTDRVLDIGHQAKVIQGLVTSIPSWASARRHASFANRRVSRSWCYSR